MRKVESMDEDELIRVSARVDWRKVPRDFRLLLVLDRTTIRIGDRRRFVEQTTDVYGFVEGLKPERGEILEAFSRLEFIINEILKFELLGVPTVDTDWSKRKFFDEIMNYVDFSNKINWLRERMNLGKKQKQKLDNLRRLRNGYAHIWREDEIQYKNRPIKIKSCFKEFKDDFREVWKCVCDIYRIQQDKIKMNEVISPLLIKE